MVLAVIRQTATRSGSIEEFEKRIRERIMALSHSHDILSQVDWAGVSLAELVDRQLKPFEAVRSVQAFGPEIALDANAVLNIGMALHGLIMNATRFGLTESDGISVTWKLSSAEDGNPVEFELSWSEPALQYADPLAQHEWFGRLVLCRLVPSALSGQGTWSLASERVVWRLKAPLSRVQVGLRDPFSE